MKFSLVLPIDKVTPAGEFLGPDALRDMAAVAEASAFHACSVTDHPCPTGRWLDAGGHHAQDPFVLLGFLAGATRRVLLQTGILVLPYRNPFITARAVASLDAASGGRVVLGVGAGYLKGEYFALGADFENRNDVTDEYLRALKAAWASDEFSFEGTGYSARGVRILPRPPAAPPLWIGGNSKRAIRRAVELGDAWAPFHSGGVVSATARTAAMGGEEDLRGGLAYLREYADRIGRPAPRDIVLDSMKAPTPVWNAQALLDQVSRLAELGVTWACVHAEGRSRSEWCDNAERYSAEVVAKVSAPAG